MQQAIAPMAPHLAALNALVLPWMHTHGVVRAGVLGFCFGGAVALAAVSAPTGAAGAVLPELLAREAAQPAG